MDTAKSVGVEIVSGGSIKEYEYGHTPIAMRIPPLVAVPTTAGTGSEVTLWAVITDPERKIKFNVGGTPLIGPHVALVDPELTLGLPSAVTAATGMDALSHGIECYTCDYHQPFNDAVALRAIELAGRWLRTAVEDGSNLEARTQMAHAATLGGMAYGTESAGAAHAMSQSAGGVHDCPHGALTARVLGPVCEYNAPAAPERYARIAVALGVRTDGMAPPEAALAGVEEIYRLTDDVGIPTMEELGFARTRSRCWRGSPSRTRRRSATRARWTPRATRRSTATPSPEGGHEHCYARLLDGDRRRLGRQRVGVATGGDEPGDGRDDRHRPRGVAGGRATGDSSRQRGLARLGGAVAVRARGVARARRGADRRTPRRPRADADARPGQAAPRRGLR